MYQYQFWQWLLFFFIYCFLGWCWESAYVSVRQHKWVNRGFMNGPFLPIYGFGAMAVLLSTIPVKEYPMLVYLFGMLGATLLELVTGMGMEWLFHVRYWDYSSQRCNYKGHICLSSSVAWGFFSMAMIYGFHKPIEGRVLALPEGVGTALAFVITAVVAADFAVSFKTAMELRDILDGMERIREEAKRLQRRAEILEAFLSDSVEKKGREFAEKRQLQKQELLLELQEIREKQQRGKERLKDKFSSNAAVNRMLQRNPSAASANYAAALLEYKERFLAGVKEELEERLEDIRQEKGKK